MKGKKGSVEKTQKTGNKTIARGLIDRGTLRERPEEKKKSRANRKKKNSKEKHQNGEG